MPVTQADRDAAADIMEDAFVANYYRAGLSDQSKMIQAFAAHREAALDEAAGVAFNRLYPLNPKDDWTRYAEHMAEAAIAARATVLALKANPHAE